MNVGLFCCYDGPLGALMTVELLPNVSIFWSGNFYFL